MIKKTLLFSLLVSAFAMPSALASVELGASIGTPAGFNFSLGNWSPLLLRASGGYWGKSIHGVQGEIGYTFDHEGKLWQYVALADTSIGGTKIQWDGVGPTYTLDASGFLFQFGLSIGHGYNNDGKKIEGAQVLFQIGYSYIWGQK